MQCLRLAIPGSGNRLLNALRAPNYLPYRSLSLSPSLLSSQKKKQHVNSEVVEGVLVVRMDTEGSKVNTLGPEFSSELVAAMEEGLIRDDVTSAVIISSKPGTFIAGADIAWLDQASNQEEMKEISQSGQAMIQSLESSSKPVVAAISGSCLGGGLEVALGCHYRIAMDEKKTTLGVPEVMLGLLPGAGGTQRLPRLIGLQEALPMLLTGKQVKANKAKRIGLVDQLVQPIGAGVTDAKQNNIDYLEKVAINTAKNLVSGKQKIPERTKPWMSMKGLMFNAITHTKYGRNYALDQATKMVMKQTQGVYPAPLKILDVTRVGLEKGGVEGYEAESEGFAELGMTTHSKALKSIFFAQTESKKNRFGDPKKPAKNIAVLGAGLMGAGIAQVSIDKGMKVTLKDTNEQGISRGYQQIYKGINLRAKKRSITTFERDQIMSNLGLQTDYAQFKGLDIVIEAVFEDINLKHRVLKECEAATSANCIFASNTSALPITEIAAASSRPENVIGMHYFSPVDKMPLLEIITTDKTSKEASAMAVDIGLRQGKTVIVVGDGPGFYTTRILAPMLDECLTLFQEGVRPQELDNYTKTFGWPVGMATLADEVGLDVAYHVSKDMSRRFGARIGGSDIRLLEELVKAGHLGRKVGKGVYLYSDKEKGGRKINEEAEAILKKFSKQTKGSIEKEEVQWRVASRFINEAIFTLQEGILKSPTDGDLGAIFGLGFPPFHGGPFRFLDTFGANKFLSKMLKFRETYGVQFEPAPLLQDMAKENKRFHPK